MKYIVNVLPDHENLDSQFKIEFEAETDEAAEDIARDLAEGALPVGHTADCFVVIDEGIRGYRTVAEFEAN